MPLNYIFAGRDFALKELHIFLSFRLHFYYLNTFDERRLKWLHVVEKNSSFKFFTKNFHYE